MMATVIHWWIDLVIAGFLCAPVGAGLLGLKMIAAERRAKRR